MNDADVDAKSDHNVPADAVPVPDHIPNVIDPQPVENNNLQLDLDQPFNDAPGSPPIMNPPDSPNVPQLPDNRNLCMTCLVVSLAESEHCSGGYPMVHVLLEQHIQIEGGWVGGYPVGWLIRCWVINSL
ncbi:unnamed protein product [Macrosiphum euphorbiae]|uniref:Uncharacterized protein n=1 Tax=Macrosiphum euphorbiae TaxID=13131 RepID=A0AAV0WE91_9HEMI|nr:unnamed protein product [Macrosiphum euphorbiae]